MNRGLGERAFARAGGGSRQPFCQVFVNLESALVVQRESHLGTDRREPKFVAFVFQLLQNPSPVLDRSASTTRCGYQVAASIAQDLPIIFIGGRRNDVVPDLHRILHRSDPRQASSTEVGGTTSATGFPKRVTRIGVFVDRTRSSTARHLALNSEMATSCRAFLWWSFYPPAGQSRAAVPP